MSVTIGPIHASFGLSALTARQALDDLTKVDPRYAWRDLGGVVVIRPVSAWKGQRSPLNWPSGVQWDEGSARALAQLVALVSYDDMNRDPSANEWQVRRYVRRGTILTMNATIRPRKMRVVCLLSKRRAAQTATPKVFMELMRLAPERLTKLD
jgi:hypothetical protein